MCVTAERYEENGNKNELFTVKFPTNLTLVKHFNLLVLQIRLS